MISLLYGVVKEFLYEIVKRYYVKVVVFNEEYLKYTHTHIRINILISNVFFVSFLKPQLVSLLIISIVEFSTL